jgi:phage/plasmid-like protein (TIGR03299 family)
MAYAGDTPWHGLGKPVSNDLTPAQMAVEADCFWQVEKQPIYQHWGEQYREVPGRFNLTRMSDGKVLDLVGPLFQPVQNVDALGFFTEFVSAGGMKMETAGSLEGGRRVWGLASIQDGFTLAGGDRVEGYLLLCNPHRQGEAFTIKFTPVRVVCHNTITMALAGSGASFRMSHANRFDIEMQQEAKVVLGLAKSRLR